MERIDLQIEGGAPSPFQLECMRRLTQVLTSHGLPPPAFQSQERGWFLADIVFRGSEYQLEVYGDMVVMHEGRSYYEAYMRDEQLNEQTLIDGFATRLDRMLSGGPWEGPNEAGSPSWFREKVRKLFRR